MRDPEEERTLNLRKLTSTEISFGDLSSHQPHLGDFQPCTSGDSFNRSEPTSLIL